MQADSVATSLGDRCDVWVIRWDASALCAPEVDSLDGSRQT